ncbi:MAG: tetratricopeptide repeat protein [Acidobacteriaceae bacterium]|nr:tetratricopeptide repeat protein [Acidobacteriaceae bacterium]MBV9781812.1 tetratricopeptide repeat protein [Acidobacteriaceae bacterium]
MFHLYFNPLRSTCLPTLALTIAASVPAAQLAAQMPAAKPGSANPTLPEPTKQASSSKSAAYYHYSLGHLYEELAGSYGNRTEYVNKAIDNYRLAMKEDPSASFLVEEVAELYRVSGRIREAVEEAQTALKNNPEDLNARRVLARIYTQQIGDAQTNHVDEGMARKAVEEYKIIAEKDPKDVDSMVMLGRLDKLLGNSVDAEAAFRKVLAADPDNEDAITGLAGVYSDRGDARAASELLEKLTKKNPSPRALVVLANNYEQMRQYAQAADAYRKALALDPNRVELKAALAQDQALAGKLDDALKTYQELADANPRDAQPYLGMSQIYRERKDFAQARKMSDKAKEIDPENLEVRYNEVGLLEDEGKTNEAIATLKGILDSTSRHNYDENQRANRSKMLEQLGYLYRNSDQYDQAVDAYRQIAALDANFAPRAEAQIIDTYRAEKDYAKAQQESDAALKKFPNERTIREVYAQLLTDEGKSDTAIAELKKSLDGKNDREIYIAIAEVYEKSRNYSEMSKALDAAEKLSQDKSEKATVLFMRGAMYERQKQYDLAEKMFRQVLDVDPANASALNYLGYMLADRNVRLPEAQDLIKRAVDTEPNNYAFLDSLGWVYYRLNRLDDAQRQLERSLQLMSKDPTIHDHLGDVYFKQGKIKQAIDQWQSSLKAWSASSPADLEPEEVAKVQKKLDSARVRLAQEQGPKPE